MGSWNSTCHLSNLPILFGDNVVVIVYIEHNSYESEIGYYNFYPNSVFTPILPPIYDAKYDDYGGIYGDKLEEENKIVMDCVKLFKFTQGEEEITFSSIKDFIHKLERSDLSEKEIRIHKNGIFESENGYKVKFAMYHSDIYNGLVNENKEKTEFENTKKTLKELFEKSKTDYFLRDPDGIFHTKGIINDYMFLNVPDLDNFVSRVLDLEYFGFALQALRKGYGCITGCGSQSENFEFHFFFNNLVRKHIINYMKKRLTDYCDDEEFESKYDLSNCEITDDIAIEYMEKHKNDIW